MDTHRCTRDNHRLLPLVGDRVWFVPDCYGEPVMATVVAVDMNDMEDLNVWRWHRDPATAEPVLMRDREGRPLLVDWPNPNVTMLDDNGARQITRHSRYLGSPGWAWPLARSEAVS